MQLMFAILAKRAGFKPKEMAEVLEDPDAMLDALYFWNTMQSERENILKKK